MPGQKVEHKIKGGVERKPNHDHYVIVPKRVWYSEKQGPAVRGPDKWYKRKGT